MTERLQALVAAWRQHAEAIRCPGNEIYELDPHAALAISDATHVCATQLEALVRATPASPSFPPAPVFEVVDATTPETYWTLGLFPSLSAALAALDALSSPDDLPPDRDVNDEYCRIEVRERTLSWNNPGVGKLVHAREWEHVFDEEADEAIWRRLPAPAPVRAPPASPHPPPL